MGSFGTNFNGDDLIMTIPVGSKTTIGLAQRVGGSVSKFFRQIALQSQEISPIMAMI